ncbi:MAG: hypothetical protein K6D38_04960 [Pseudobutyrivibrio sp.]|nr:hypothetical protein [Pseudobutyrivibrio sp.]
MGLSELRARLDALKAQKRQIEADIDKYQKRRADVEKLKKKLTEVGDDNYGKVNKWGNSIINNFDAALKGTSSVAKVVVQVNEELEKASLSDASISSGITEMTNEISRIDRVLEGLYSDLQTCNANIRATEEAIAAELRRLAEEAARAAANR